MPSFPRVILPIAFVVLFLGVGLWQSWQAQENHARPPLTPLSYLEGHAEYGTGRAAAVPEIAAALARLPGKRPLLLFYAPEKIPSCMAADVVSYLSWPRPIVHGGASPLALGRSLPQLAQEYAALVLCGSSTLPPSEQVWRIGPGLTIVNLTGVQAP